MVFKYTHGPLQDNERYLTYISLVGITLTCGIQIGLAATTTMLVWDLIRMTGLPGKIYQPLWLIPVAGFAPMVYHVSMCLQTIWVKYSDSNNWIDPYASMLVGSKYTIEFKTAIDPNIPSVSEHEAIDAINDDRELSRRVYTVKIWSTMVSIMLCGVVVTGNITTGLSTGMFMAMVFYLAHVVRDNVQSNEVPQKYAGKQICAPDGVYDVYDDCFIGRYHVGIGYMQNGSFTTRLHVTNGLPINIQGAKVTPSYINKKADTISYGAIPTIHPVEEQDTLKVMLCGPYSNIVIPYTTVAAIGTDGEVYFNGRRNMSGTSGSPIFKVVSKGEGIEWAYVGCTGWRYECKGRHVQSMYPVTDTSHDLGEVNIGSVVQHFSSPGSGKTRTIIPELTIKGLAQYGRVYIVGPTNVVSSELYSALKDSDELADKVSLNTSAATPRQRIRGMPVTIMAHATALSMLENGDHTVSRPGLWIMDEAHFANTGSQCLKVKLRNIVAERKSALYELTATGYHMNEQKYIYCDGSNYHIEDTILSPDDMLEKAYQDERKMVIFVTKLKGKDATSAETMRAKFTLLGRKVYTLSRNTFNDQYLKARADATAVILTTDISECGANLDVDVVYDFQESPKPLMMGGPCNIRVGRRQITRTQAIQRRGRTGRKREGQYISPTDYRFLEDEDNLRAESLDVSVYAKAYGYTVHDPGYQVHVPAALTLSIPQVRGWLGSGENSLSEGAAMVKILTLGDGSRKDSSQIRAEAIQWSKGIGAEMRVKDEMVGVATWDDRDASSYYSVAEIAGILSKDDIPKYVTPVNIITKLSRWLRPAPIPPRPRRDSSSDEPGEDRVDEEESPHPANME
uniref:ORF1 n=1 Tax=Ailanthus flavi-like virus TaxID=3051859 RepID=A0A9Y2DXE9_9FLAV|nr:ORF1 [Ailanthus flavi-like virus]